MSESQSAFSVWINERLPVKKVWRAHVSEYYVPKNLNFWYFFGSFALFVFVNQILTGIWLTMAYNPTATGAFASIELFMRDVSWGWLIRYLHSTGASAFFVVVYLHILRCLLYGSYQKPRELLWLFGVFIYLTLMAEAFMGYLLPWGQMSYWGAQVITSLFGSIPYIGPTLLEWIRGDYVVSGVTLTRFFALHVVALPLVLIALVFFHIVALHQVGSNNPDGIDIKKNKDERGIPREGIPFHPYYTVKDLMGLVAFLIIFLGIVFFAPELGGYFLEHDNFTPANPLVTPLHIKPVWYFTPFYAILRAIPNKLMGVLGMGASILVLFFVPWLDRSLVKSIRYRGPLSKLALALFVVSFIALGVLGGLPATPQLTFLAQVFSVLYFLFFILMPLYTKLDKHKTPPDHLT